MGGSLIRTASLIQDDGEPLEDATLAPKDKLAVWVSTQAELNAAPYTTPASPTCPQHVGYKND